MQQTPAFNTSLVTDKMSSLSNMTRLDSFLLWTECVTKMTHEDFSLLNFLLQILI